MTRSRSARWALAIGMLASILTTGVLAVPASAQSLRNNTSLKFAPADSSFYLCLLRNREQMERLLHSRAFARFQSMPFVQQGWEQLQQNEDWQKLKTFFEQPENQQLQKVLIDALSHEVFLFGDERCADWFSALSRFGNAVNMAQLRAATSGQSPEEVIRGELAAILTENPELFQIPSVVWGFRVSDEAAAQQQLDRLELLLRQVMQREMPELLDRMTREEYLGGSFLVTQLDGSLVPWDKMLNDMELSDDDRAKVKQQLVQAKVTIAIGLWNGYLVIAKGESSERLLALSEGSLLADRRELAPLLKAPSLPITSIGYASQRFLQKISAVDQQIDQFVNMGQAAVPRLPMDQETQDAIKADLKQLGQQLKAFVPEIGAVMGYEYTTDEGYESVRYNWSEQKTLDGSRPLTILSHLGGEPLAFYASRTKAQPELYEFTRFWMGKLGGYVERMGRPLLNDDQQQLYDGVKREMLPLLSRLHKANQERLAPAFADGQSMLLLEAQSTSAQWCNFMEPSEEPLPLPQLACVYGISDADLLRTGAAEYLDVLQTAVMKMSELMPERIPPIPIPGPTSETVSSGTVYQYALPEMFGVDARMAPNAGVSDDALAITLMPETTERLLSVTPFQGSGPLANVDRPLATAWHFSLRRLAEVARPWVHYGWKVAGENASSVDEEVVQQVDTILDLIGCIRDVSGVSFFENDALVTRMQSRIEDLKE